MSDQHFGLTRSSSPAAAHIRTRWEVAAGVLVVAAAMLRMIGLTSKALWFDETVSVFVSNRPIEQVLALVRVNEPHPPLHYLLLQVWTALFGQSEASVRLLSVLISVPVVLVTWRFGRRLVGAVPALFAALLVMLAPSQVAAGQEARMYGLLTLTSLASWWAMWEALEGGPRKAWTAYVVVTAALLYTHYFGFFVLASQGFYLLVRRTAALAQWRRWAPAFFAILLLFLPWFPAFRQQLAGGRAWPEHRLPLTWPLPVDTLSAMTVGRPILEYADPRKWTIQATDAAGIAVLGFAAALVLAAMALRSRAHSRDVKMLVLCAVLGPLALALGTSLVTNVYAPRYMVFIVPPIALLIGTGVATVAAGGGRRTVAAAALAVAVLLPNVLGLVSFYRQPRLDVFDWRLISRTLAAQSRPDDAIVFLPGFARIPVNYYFTGPQIRLALTPQGGDVEGPMGLRMAGVVASLTRSPRVWILTVPPVPGSVNVLIGSLQEKSYIVTRQESVNMARLVLLERKPSP